MRQGPPKMGKLARELVRQFPVRSKALRRELVGEDTCPNCGSGLTTRWKCSECTFDGKKMVPARYLALALAEGDRGD